MVNKKTKIVATIGPSSLHESIVTQMIEAGVNVFRFNMKHGDIQWHEDGIELVQGVADKLKTPVGILIDLQGPEIRINTNADIVLEEGDEIEFRKDIGDEPRMVSVPYDAFFEVLKKGDHFSIDDGFHRFEVVRKTKQGLKVRAQDAGVVSNRKGLNLVAKDIPLPSLIEDDIKKLDLATRKKVDFVALSFVRTKEDVMTLKRVMEKKKIDAKIVSKIESQKGIDNIDEIIEATDCVMVARGDLGIEVPIEQITYLQKQMIDKCRVAHKPVIVATQMLQSMIEKPLPTRAEATDVANAVFDGTDAVMLSGETASGKYPVKAVQAMSDIVSFNEEKATITDFKNLPADPTELIVEAAESITAASERIKINHLVVFTETGHTARVVAGFRPKVPVIAVTNSPKTVETLTMSYGISPMKVDFPVGKIVSPEAVLTQLKKKKLVKQGELVLLIHGQHWKIPGQTNAIVLLAVK